MGCKNVCIGDVATYRKDSIKPVAGVTYRCYSLPAFDNCRSPEILDGSEILSSKLKIEKGDILVNKLNMRFKRIWPLNELDDNSVCSTEFLPLHPKESVDSVFCFTHCSATPSPRNFRGCEREPLVLISESNPNGCWAIASISPIWIANAK